MPFVVITLPSVGTVHLSPNKKIRPKDLLSVFVPLWFTSSKFEHLVAACCAMNSVDIFLLPQNTPSAGRNTSLFAVSRAMPFVVITLPSVKTVHLIPQQKDTPICLRIGKTKILGEPVRLPWSTPCQSWREAITHLRSTNSSGVFRPKGSPSGCGTTGVSPAPSRGKANGRAGGCALPWRCCWQKTKPRRRSCCAVSIGLSTFPRKPMM